MEVHENLTHLTFCSFLVHYMEVGDYYTVHYNTFISVVSL